MKIASDIMLVEALNAEEKVLFCFGSLNPPLHIGWINLLRACGLMYGMGRIHCKIDMLKKNREIME